jgi:ABC-type lipoprotein release transport system permease subunit
MIESTVTDKGQTTVPREVREALGIKPRQRRPDVQLASVAVAAIIIIVATVFAAFYPAARASRLAPIDALGNR